MDDADAVGGPRKLVDMTCAGFAFETASESPAPGWLPGIGLVWCLGAALGTMVATLSHKPGWDADWEKFSLWAEKGEYIIEQMLHLVDEDTNSFNRIMDAFGLPKA